MSPPRPFGAYRPIRPRVTEGSFRVGHGYDGHMGILVLILVVLAIVALIFYIARRTRV
jgi:hypothetical protein